MISIDVRIINRRMLLMTAPFLGALLFLLLHQPVVKLPGSSAAAVPVVPMNTSGQVQAIGTGLGQAAASAVQTSGSIQKAAALYTQTNQRMSSIASLARSVSGRPLAIYDRRITIPLGSPSEVIQTDKLTAQLFFIKAQNFNGYALKVKLKQEGAMKLAIGGDKPGRAETTLAAVRRYNAVAGVNAGGFADDGSGARYPLSTTVMNGNYIGGFEPSYKDLFFVGLSKEGKLIGGQYSSEAQLDREKPEFGVSFVPVLMKNGVAQPIPLKWQLSPLRAPRTVVANYKDDQLLFLVVDGYTEDGSSGATLAEMQILLSRFKTVDGYNLDGGGSSTLVFNGRVVNHPSDKSLRPLATNFLFFS
jgi:exopolysaccharide biosynthesis protein